MLKNLQTKGYLLALAAAFTATNTYFTSKYILRTNTVFQFGFLWYGFGMLFNLILLGYSKQLSGFGRLSRHAWLGLIIFSIAEVINTTAFFTGVQQMENPAIASFLANLAPPLVTVAGIFLLKERFNGYEMAGILTAITGAFLVCFHRDMGSMFVKGSGFILVSVVFSAFNSVLTKRFVTEVNPTYFSLARVIALFIFSCVALIYFGNRVHTDFHSLGWAAYGAFVGPLLGAYAIYHSFKYISAAKSVVIQSLKSFIILIGAYLILGLWPSWIQVAGGVLSVCGVVLITVYRKLYRTRISS